MSSVLPTTDRGNFKEVPPSKFVREWKAPDLEADVCSGGGVGYEAVGGDDDDGETRETPSSRRAAEAKAAADWESSQTGELKISSLFGGRASPSPPSPSKANSTTLGRRLNTVELDNSSVCVSTATTVT